MSESFAGRWAKVGRASKETGQQGRRRDMELHPRAAIARKDVQQTGSGSRD